MKSIKYIIVQGWPILQPQMITKGKFYVETFCQTKIAEFTFFGFKLKRTRELVLDQS